MVKIVRIDKRAAKEIKKFPELVQAKIQALLTILSKEGELSEPQAKKISRDLFEIRIRYRGQWRVIYAYVEETLVVVLSAFAKKSPKTPTVELAKAKSRLKGYLL